MFDHHILSIKQTMNERMSVSECMLVISAIILIEIGQSGHVMLFAQAGEV